MKHWTKRATGIMLIAALMVFMLAGCSTNTAKEDPKNAENAAQEQATEPEVSEEAASSADDSATVAEPMTFKAIAPEGATTISMVKMIYEQPVLAENVTVDYETLTATDLLASEIMGEKTDFAIVPTNLAIKLYNKGVPYKFASINTHGNLYMVTSLDISTWEDLKGKDIYMIGQGLIPDLIFRYLAKANGLNPDEDFNIIYLAGTTELAPTFLAGKSTISIMPEPVLSVVGTKEVPFKVLFDFQTEFEKATGLEGGFPQAGLMIKNSVAEAYPQVVDAFIGKLAESCTWVNENPEQAGTYVQELDLGLPAPIVAKAMDGLNIWHENAYENKASLENFYQILFEASPDSIGGKLPDEGFYYK